MTGELPLLPILARSIVLRCLRATETGLFPERRLASLLLSADAGHKRFADSIALEVPRSGRIRHASGEPLRFALYALAAHRERLGRIEALLRALPQAAPRRGPDIAFGDNWVVETVEDLVPGGAIDAQAIEREAAPLRASGRARMRLVSPVRMALGRGDKARGRARFAQSEADVTDAALSHALTQSLVALKFCCGAEDWQAPNLRLRIVRKELFLVAPGLAGSAKSFDPRRKPLDEGLMGEIVVEPADPQAPDPWPLLVLLQYFGIGQSRAFGLGRFQCETLDGECRKHRQRTTHVLLSQAADERNLGLAWRHVAGADDLREWPGPVLAGDDADDLRQPPSAQCDAWLDALSQTLAEGNHAPAPLRPVEIAKPDGGVRRLQIPGFRDRVAQRAVLQVLEPALDPLFSDAAYGFRRGRGREQARDRLLMHERAGDRIVGETDIRAFFDAVAWWRIETRLRCLLGDEPAVDQILRWLEAPCTEGEPRTQGLPQGAPLSPLLSHLMLDRFDRAMTRAGHRHLRHGDTLVVVGAHRGAVEAALARAARLFADMGCAPDRDAVRIAAFADGVRAFGYRFLGGLSLPGRRAALSVAVDERGADDADAWGDAPRARCRASGAEA